ncbi:MAG: DUF4080 domain-containing protein [Clostridia bacterium]
MKKTIILALNSKFIHSSLALWYLKASCSGIDGVIALERTINEPFLDVLHAVLDTRPDILCCSCYIWNIEYVLKLCHELKLILPELKIVLGGPEVSFRADEILHDHSAVDVVLVGEGEVSLPLVIADIDEAASVAGACTRHSSSSYQYISDMNTIISPYTPEMLASLHGKLAYYESSRGCPFSCAYCLSSATHGVRNLPLSRVKEELVLLSHADVRTIKFVDRTFNADISRAKEIIRFILSNTGDVCFHFEVGADLFDDETLALLKSAPPGKFQIEAGIQSTNEETLMAVARKTDTALALKTLSELRSYGNIHVHSDLICGLPYEDIDTFSRSFDMLYAVAPHALQLGFLKMLHGSPLRARANEYNYVFSSGPPYEFYKNDFMSPYDITVMHDIEDALEKYYNSGRFPTVLSYINTVYDSPFDFYLKLSQHLTKHAGRRARISPDRLAELLLSFCTECGILDVERTVAALAFDYSCCGTSRQLPHALSDGDVTVKQPDKRFIIKRYEYDMQKPQLPAGTHTYIISRTERDAITNLFTVKMA